MGLNAEISLKLLSFHRGISDEYQALLKFFNIYAYGFGYKLDLLKEVFPDIFVVDFSEGETVMTSRSLYEYHQMEPKETDLKRALQHISTLITREESKPIVLLHAKKDVLSEMDNLKIILVQHRELYLSFDELLQYQYVMRDLTTFTVEQKKRAGMSARIDEALNVYDCVGGLSKRIFRFVLKASASRAEFSLRDIFNREKKKLLIVNYSSFREALSAFIDSNILVEKSGVSKLNLNKKELAEIISIIDKSE